MVAHFCTNNTYLDKLSYIGTEYQIIVSIYAYSPFTLLSCAFVAESSPCVGRYIGKHLRPSIVSTKYIVNNTIHLASFVTTGLSIYVNLTSACLSIHVILLPAEFMKKTMAISIHFENELISIRKADICNGEHCLAFYIEGSYYLDGASAHYMEMIGQIKQVLFILNPGQLPVATLTITEAPCIQSCGDKHSILAQATGHAIRCNVCRYHWFDNKWNREAYHTTWNKTIHFQHILGNHHLRICLSTPVELWTGGHISCYMLFKLTCHFDYKRYMTVDVENDDIWRVDQQSLIPFSFVQETEYKGLTMVSYKDLRIHMGLYEYVALSQYGYSGKSGDMQCQRQGASLLTIFDYKELYFVIKRIMQPLKLERIPIAWRPQVRPVQAQIITINCKHTSYIFRRRDETNSFTQIATSPTDSNSFDRW